MTVQWFCMWTGILIQDMTWWYHGCKSKRKMFAQWWQPFLCVEIKLHIYHCEVFLCPFVSMCSHRLPPWAMLWLSPCRSDLRGSPRNERQEGAHCWSHVPVSHKVLYRDTQQTHAMISYSNSGLISYGVQFPMDTSALTNLTCWDELRNGLHGRGTRHGIHAHAAFPFKAALTVKAFGYQYLSLRNNIWKCQNHRHWDRDQTGESGLRYCYSDPICTQHSK